MSKGCKCLSLDFRIFEKVKIIKSGIEGKVVAVFREYDNSVDYVVEYELDNDLHRSWFNADDLISVESPVVESPVVESPVVESPTSSIWWLICSVIILTWILFY